MQIINSIILALSSEVACTLMLCVVVAFGTALFMRFVMKGALKALDEYVENNVDSAKPFYGVYYSVKSFLYSGIAFLIVVFGMSKVFAVAQFPLDNSMALFYFYCIPVYALQWILDKYMKPLAEKWFGITLNIEDDSEEKPKKVKVRKPKVKVKKVKYYIDSETGEEKVIE